MKLPVDGYSYLPFNCGSSITFLVTVFVLSNFLLLGYPIAIFREECLVHQMLIAAFFISRFLTRGLSKGEGWAWGENASLGLVERPVGFEEQATNGFFGNFVSHCAVPFFQKQRFPGSNLVTCFFRHRHAQFLNYIENPLIVAQTTDMSWYFTKELHALWLKTSHTNMFSII